MRKGSLLSRLFMIPAGILAISMMVLGGCRKGPETGPTSLSNPEERSMDQSVSDKYRPYLGLSESKAREFAAKNGQLIRVMRIDGEDMMGTADYVENRIDVAIENGVIIPW